MVAWAEQVPESWPWAHVAAMLARAWAAHRRNEPCTATVLRMVIVDTARLGLQLYETEALELAAAHVAVSQPEVAAMLLGAATSSHVTTWVCAGRYPYHERGATIAAATCEQALGPAALAAARERGAAAGSLVPPRWRPHYLRRRTTSVLSQRFARNMRRGCRRSRRAVLCQTCGRGRRSRC